MIPLGILAGVPRASVVVPGDPDWESVVALLHFNGSDGSTTFTDETGKTWTANGNAQLDIAEKKFGSASLLLDGNGDYLSCSNSELNLSNGDYTVEAFGYLTSTSVTRTLFSSFQSQSFGRYYVQVLTNGQLGFFEQDASGGNTVSAGSSAGAFTLNAWHHVAAVKDGTTMRLFLDGVQVATNTSAVRTGFAGHARIGRLDSGSFEHPWVGHIDEYRITKGVARYTSNFTPPAAPFPNFAET